MKGQETEDLTLKSFFGDFKCRYVIPDYQRPYVWSVKECETLWDDLLEFSCIESPNSEFDRTKDYVLGYVITATREDGSQEIIDGQQRTITLLLLFRALFNEMPDDAADKINIGKCIWQYTQQGSLLTSQLKIFNDILLDDDKDFFNEILITGAARKGTRDNYSKNFKFFRSCVCDLAKNYSQSSLQLFANCILENVILIKTTHVNRNNAIALFESHNAKGVPLAKTDLFKSRFCRIVQSSRGYDSRNKFCEKWQKLADLAHKIFKQQNANGFSSLDFAFLIYARQFLPCDIRAQKYNWKNYTNFYYARENNLLNSTHTVDEIFSMLHFFAKVAELEKSDISERACRLSFILLNTARASFWELLARFFFKNRNNRNIPGAALETFLERFIAVVIGFVSCHFGRIGQLKEKVYTMSEFIFNDAKEDCAVFSAALIKDRLLHLGEIPSSTIVANIILYWWTFINDQQPFRQLKKLECEHIFPVSLAQNSSFANPNCINLLGNLALLESRLNKKATNFDFRNKALLYQGNPNDKNSKPTFNLELLQLAKTLSDFSEPEILSRNQKIINSVLDLLDSHGLLIRDSL